MNKRLFAAVMLVMALSAWNVVPALMQGTCNTLSPRLAVGQQGRVAYTDGNPLNVRASASRSAALKGTLTEGTLFDVLEGPTCADDINWWRIQSGSVSGWVAEAASGVYLIEPWAQPLPTSAPVTLSQGVPFATWDWSVLTQENYLGDIPDPMTLTLPSTYQGKMPAVPVNLAKVLFVDNAQLNDAQKALLARNGFVVVPGGFKQFDDAYRDTDSWQSVPANYDYSGNTADADQPLGNPFFVTTDSMLHALHYIFDNLLTDLERQSFISRVQHVTSLSLAAAVDQYGQAKGTPLETPARNAVVYLLVAAKLFDSDNSNNVPAGIDPSIANEADSIVAMAQSGEGQNALSFMPGYSEDFSQYRPRGHYAGDATLESYFRGMMWLSRITFRAEDDTETLTALMVLRALHSQPDALSDWQAVHDTLTYLIGPVDDLGPPEYSTLADQIFGSDLSLASLSDGTKLAAFRDGLTALPGPRINGLVLPNDTQASDVTKVSRGFRLMGQRFTFDAYALQQLIYPYVGTRDNVRALPLGLDVPAAMGSDNAYELAAQAGATGFEHYDTQMASLRGQIGSLTQDNWLENTYSGWLWALQPLWVRESAPYPPLMKTNAWMNKDLQTGLGSWTELKHDTVLYAKQPEGFGGGGPPLGSYGYVEPNPLVFARISIVAGLTFQGLTQHGLMDIENGDYPDLQASGRELRTLSQYAAAFAEMGRKELAGEPLTEEEYYTIQVYETYLNILLRTLYQGDNEPDPVALVTDVASNPSTQSVLQEGVGGVDTIYVVIPTPDGRLQVARGAVFSYYEFVGDINQRMTDQEWRGLFQSNQLPPRPTWVSSFFSP